jgi:endonuclease-3 related protein
MRDFYRALRRHFGYAETWWPGSPVELMLTAVLVQQCDWSTAWAGVGRLRDRGLLDFQLLAAADPDRVKSCIHPVAFAATKSKRLVAISKNLVHQGLCDVDSLLDHESTNPVRQRLLSLPGIGPETADCILLFASHSHETFVVDAYTRRVFRRLDLFRGIPQEFWDKPYETLRSFFLEHVTASGRRYDDFTFATGVPRMVALLRDFHAQIVELGKHHCLKTKPRCWTVGKAGWKDYSFCDGHCSNNGCCACPLVATCAWARNTER